MLRHTRSTNRNVFNVIWNFPFAGISALSFIVRRTPEVIPKFLAKFDSSIKVNEHEIGDVDCEIKLDFRLLVPSNERG